MNRFLFSLAWGITCLSVVLSGCSGTPQPAPVAGHGNPENANVAIRESLPENAEEPVRDVPGQPNSPPTFAMAWATESDGVVVVQFAIPQVVTETVEVESGGKKLHQTIQKSVTHTAVVKLEGEEVAVLGADGKAIAPKDVQRRLGKPATVVIFMYGQPDPFVLGVLRQDAVVFVAPPEKFFAPPENTGEPVRDVPVQPDQERAAAMIKRVKELAVVDLPVVEIDFNSSPITDADLESLKGLTSLKELQLGNTRITDAGLVHLKDCSNLEWLQLESTKVTDAGLAHLGGLRELQKSRPGRHIRWRPGTGTSERAD